MGRSNKGSRKKREEEKIVKDRAKVICVFGFEYVRIRNSSYENLTNLIHDYESQLKNNKKAKTSPRWSKISQFLKEVEEILSFIVSFVIIRLRLNLLFSWGFKDRRYRLVD